MMSSNLEARSLFKAGKKLSEEKKFSEACIKFFDAIAIDPDYIEAHIEYAGALMSSQDFVKAIYHVSQAIQIMEKDSEKDKDNNKFRFEAYFLWGVALGNQQYHKLAIDKYQEALKVYPDYPDIDKNIYISLHLVYGTALYFIGHYNKAIEILNKIMAINQLEHPLMETVVFLYAQTLNQLQNFDEAIEKYKQALSYEIPNDEKIAVLLGYGVALANSGKYPEAIENFNDALKYEQNATKEHMGNIYLNYGYALVGINKYDEAIEKFNKVIEIAANQKNIALIGIAETYFKSKNLDKLRDTYDKIVKEDIAKALAKLPNLMQVVQSVDPILMYINMIEGNKLYAYGNYTRATASYRITYFINKVIEILLGVFIPKQVYKQQLIGITQAINFYQFLNNPVYFLWLGNLYFMFFDNLNDAEEAYKKGLELDNNNIELLINLGYLYLQKHQNNSENNKYYWKAQEVLYKAENILKTNITSYEGVTTLLQIGKVYILLEKYDMAATYIIQAYEKNKKNSLPFMGLVYTYTKDFYKAIRYYTELIELEPDNLNAHINLASIYFQQTEYTEAETIYKRVLSIAPRNVEAYIGLGEIYLNMGNQDGETKYYGQSITYFQKGIKIAKSDNRSKKLTTLELSSIHYFIGYSKLKLYLASNNLRDAVKLEDAKGSFKECLKHDKYHSKANLMIRNIEERLIPLYRDHIISVAILLFAIFFSWTTYIVVSDQDKNIIIGLIPLALFILGLYFPSITKLKMGNIEIEKEPTKEGISIFNGVEIEKPNLMREKMVMPMLPSTILMPYRN